MTWARLVGCLRGWPPDLIQSISRDRLRKGKEPSSTKQRGRDHVSVASNWTFTANRNNVIFEPPYIGIMDRFQPPRSSPPFRANKTSIAPSETSSIEEPLPEELRDLGPSDVELIDAVVERAGPSATTFLTIFKAYSEVLADRGLDPQEVVYYSKLLKLGNLRARNWGEKWARVKGQLDLQKVRATCQVCMC